MLIDEFTFQKFNAFVSFAILVFSYFGQFLIFLIILQYKPMIINQNNQLFTLNTTILLQLTAYLIIKLKIHFKNRFIFDSSFYKQQQFNIWHTNKMKKSHSLFFIGIFLLLLISIKTQQDPLPSQRIIKINELVTLTDIPAGNTYYIANFQQTKSDGKLFIITVEAQRQDTIGIYTSLYYDGINGSYYKYPNYQNNTNSCIYSTMDSCVIDLPDLNQGQTKNITIYFSIEVFFTTKLTILTETDDIYPAIIGRKYNVDFSVVQAAVITLNGQQVNQYEQIAIQMQYDYYQNMGKFSLYAGVNKIPTNFEHRVQSKYMGAFTQLLLLDPLQDPTQKYYIIIEGQRGTKFQLSIKSFSKSSPKLQMNHTVFYWSSANFGSGQQMVFSMAIDYFEQQQILPLFVDINSLGGYGQFQIDYCDGLTNFTFININGQMGQVIIPVQERKQCYEQIKKQGSLTIQNLQVAIKNVAWYFSYSLGVFEGQYSLTMGPYNEKLGTLLKTQQSRTYEIQGYINQTFILKYKTISGQKQLNFTLYQCKSSILKHNKCTKLFNSITNQTIDPLTPQYMLFNFTCIQKKFYKLQITHNTLSNQSLDSQYVLLLLPLRQKFALLTPSKPIINLISQNQYQYYIVNLSIIEKQSNVSITPDTDILITMTQTNGDCLLLTSLTQKQPKYDMIFAEDPTVDYSWTGKRQFNLNSKDNQVIYIGVLGAAESLYHIQLTIQVNEDIPEKYTKLVSDKLLSYSLSSEEKQDHILLTYTAHSIPYTIIVSPTPSCIIYSYTLPITNKTCRDLPYSLTQKVIYMKIYRNFTEGQSSKTDDNKDFKFTVFVYSGMYYLFEYTPVMIACIDQCYQYVKIYVPEKIKVVHKGMGSISLLESNETYSNQKMEITCSKNYPCFQTVNASLPWGGDMELFYDSADIQQIQWISKPLTFENSFDPKYFYMPIRSWSQINTAIFYTQGMSVEIYYNIYTMRQNATNALEYGFPNSYTHMKKSQGNPLRRFHIVQFDKPLIQKLGCSDTNQLCIATLTVYPKSNVDYSIDYIKNSIGYFSSNTFQYWVPVNLPYQLSQQYSLLYFRHQLSQDQINNLPQYYYVKVQPLSNCRPQIFAPTPYNDPNDKNKTILDNSMPFYGSYRIDASIYGKNSSTHNVNFSVSSDSPCQYMIWLLDNDVQPIIENVNYQLVSDQNGNVVVVFSDKYLWNNRQFVINVDQIVNQIVINTYQKYANGSIKLPTSSNGLAYNIQAKQLKFNAPKTQDYKLHLYTIKLATHVGQKVNLKVSTYQSQTILLTNQNVKFTFSEQAQSFSYRYYSNNDFLMFVTSDMGSVKLTVTDWKRDTDRNVVEQYLDQNSNPWIKVQAIRGDIRQYVIKFEQVLLANGNGRNLQATIRYPKINLHIQESGTIGLPQLYDGIALFDSFYQQNAQNCYKYIAGQILGRPSLSVNLIFGSQFMNNLPNITSRITLSSGNRINSTWTKLPTGYKLSTQFYANQVYQFCFSINEQPYIVSKQFYIMAENVQYSLKHLTLDVPMSSNLPLSYQIYQYVATQKQNVMIEVVNCYGKPTLLGAKQYSDIYNGQISQLGSFYRDQTKSIAIKQLDLGYYYFGIKLDQYTDRYKIRVQLLQLNQKIHYDKFQLKQKTITKVKSLEQNGQKKVRVNLPKININNLPNQVRIHHITYNLFVDNLKDYQQYSSNIIAKCPILGNRNMSSFKATKNFLGSIKVGQTDGQNDQVTVDVPFVQIPQLFNLTGYAEISISEPYKQTLTYYYQSSTFKLTSVRSNNKGMGLFTIIFIVLLIIGSLIVAYVVYRKWKQRKQRAKIAFEMATYNHNENDFANNTAANNQKIEQTLSPSTSPSKSLRKALNENVGYGQFIDENI